MSGLTRFKTRIGVTSNGTGQFEDGAVSGAIQAIPMLYVETATALATNTTVTRSMHFPTGMAFRVTDVHVFCGTVTSDPSFTMGTAVSGTQIVAAANLASGANQMTIKSYTPAATGTISFSIVTDAGDSILDPLIVTVFGYPIAAPTSVRQPTGKTVNGTVTAYR